jgi:hypothetical protein
LATLLKNVDEKILMGKILANFQKMLATLPKMLTKNIGNTSEKCC